MYTGKDFGSLCGVPVIGRIVKYKISTVLYAMPILVVIEMTTIRNLCARHAMEL